MNTMLIWLGLIGCAAATPAQDAPTMTADTIPEALITAVSHSLDCQGASCTLVVHWRAENTADVPLHLLIAQPIQTALAEPLVLDHLQSPADVPANVNQPAPFSLAQVAPHDSLTTSQSYAIALAVGASVTIIGRFGVSRTPPHPTWQAQQQWPSVYRWAAVVYSPPFLVERD